MTREEVIDRFKKGFDCSQVVLMSFGEELGYDEEELARIASAFGGGMFHGDTCGCVSGALMALGMKYGHETANDWERKAEIRKRAAGFEKAFCERCGSLYCRELLSYDFAEEGALQKARESGVMMERCPGFVLAAIEEVEKLW